MFVKMSLAVLLFAVLVAGTTEYNEAVNQALLFQPYTNYITEGTEAPPTKPTFCKKLDCPLYKVIESQKDKYELREYEQILWVGTRVQNIDYDQATYTNFMKLFRYISGNNAKSKKIAMTVPVLNKIIPGQGPACESDFTMDFFLTQDASKFSTYPRPNNTEVTIVTTPKLRAYVRSFSGYFRSYDAWRKEAMKLIADIGDQSKYDTSAWYTAGYDSPFTLFNRHNEVWFIAK